MNKRDTAVAELEGRIGHVFRDRDLLEQALTHASVGATSPKTPNNERLEFLGDRVLNLMAAERLMELRPTAKEGELSKLINQLVNYQACAQVGREIGLPEALRLNAGAAKIGARDNDRILGDACEALIAALYLEGGLEVARAFFREAWISVFDGLDTPRNKDAKTLLQEWAMARGLPVPAYVVVSSSGPSHAPTFTIEVRIPGFDPETAQGGSKREAEKAAADLMLAKREKDA